VIYDDLIRYQLEAIQAKTKQAGRSPTAKSTKRITFKNKPFDLRRGLARRRWAHPHRADTIRSIDFPLSIPVWPPFALSIRFLHKPNLNWKE